MDFKQITQKLNDQFKSETRRLVFWYDEAGEFAEDIDQIELENAKLYKLAIDNQFYTKYFLEREDQTTNYLIYAPFVKPSVRDNHLADTIKYSKEFFADRASLICVDLRIKEEYKPVIQKYIKFFAAKDRAEKFYQFELEKFNKTIIETALMSILCKCRTASFDEVVRAMLMEANFQDNKYMNEIEKFGLTEAFWQLCEEHFGYHETTPSIKKLAITFFITYTVHYMHAEPPKSWAGFVSFKSGTIIAFMDNVMNNVIYRDTYNRISKIISNDIKADQYFAEMDLTSLYECDTFEIIDELIIKWINDKLTSENIDAKIDNKDILAICRERIKKHFGEKYFNLYKMLYHAFGIINNSNYGCPEELKKIIKQYEASDCLIDGDYRGFYSCYDKLEYSENFEQLRELVENVYTNEYLDKISITWTAALKEEMTTSAIPLQRNFYNRYIKSVKERVIVIVSDAMRYEVAHELWGKFNSDEKCTATIEMMMGVLPSYTKLGMGSLLPHKKLEITDDYRVLVDEKTCDTTIQREGILKSANINSKGVIYNDIISLKRDALRKIFSGAEVVYIYHDQIDSRGETKSSENEVFTACSEAIDEIYKLVRKLTEDVTAIRYIITADHGFIYKREKLQESDKIDGLNNKNDFVNRRFIISNEPIYADGTTCYDLSDILDNDDTKKIIVPSGSNVFKTSGGGQNYVHGGASPQEMLIPVINVKTQKGHMETRAAVISLVSIMTKITSLIISLDFIQSEPVTDIIKATTYKLFFVSDDNEKISNECVYVADNKDNDAQKRVFRLKFTFKNKKYDRNKRYSLVVFDVASEMNDPVWSHDVVMDLAFADDYGF